MVYFILNISILFKMLKGAFYNSNNWRKKNTLILIKIETAEVWPIASAGHIHKIYYCIYRPWNSLYGNVMGIVITMTSQA